MQTLDQVRELTAKAEAARTRRRHENPSRAEGKRRTKLHFVALEFTGDCEADVYATLGQMR